jgi:RHH-type transcriptional regulator, rel operon repressor / antitoxin RelB
MSQTETVTIRLPAELKTKLTALAASTNRSKSWLAAQAIATYVDEQSWQIQQIEEAVALADSDKATWVPAAEVDKLLEIGVPNYQDLLDRLKYLETVVGVHQNPS